MTASTDRLQLRVSSDGRHFVDGAGAPFFWLGDTAWPLFTSYPAGAAAAYLAARARQGFTVVQGVLAWGDPNAAVSLEGTPPGRNPDGELPWLASPAEPNERFFHHADALLRIAADHGLVLAVFPTWGYNVNNAGAFDAASAYAYGRWLGERYRAQPNIVWVAGGDREPLGFEEIYRALARGLRDGDGGAHLITYHPCGWRSSSYYFHDEEWLDFDMIETWTEWTRIHPAVLADVALAPRKPVVLGEPAYEDGPEYPLGPITPLLVRRQAWWAVTAGGFFTYGHNQSWRMEPGWQSALEAPGAQQMGLLRRIVESRAWWSLTPDQSLLADGVGAGRTLNTALRARDRSGALVYFSGPGPMRIFVDRIATPAVRATWVSPQSGEQLDGGTYATGNRPGGVFPQWTTQWFETPPRWEDAVLLLDGVVGEAPG